MDLRRLLLACALSVPLLSPPAFATPQDAPPDPGAAEAGTDEPLDEKALVAKAKRLLEEARPFFRAAGNVDLDRDERREARREAYKRLWEGKQGLDRIIEQDESAAERLDAVYSDMAMMMFWLRKEAGIGEFDDIMGIEAKPRKPRWADVPKPEPEAPAPGPEPEPGPAEPAPPPPPSAADVLDEIRTYGQRFPGDVPGLYEQYSQFLVAFPDRDAPEYGEALAELERLNERMKDVYRNIREDDPDALENADDREILAALAELVPDLESESPPVRARAARYIGALGSGKAASDLVKRLDREDDADAREAVIEALVKIGGRRIVQRLLRVEADEPAAPLVVEVLERTVENGGVKARIAGEALATYVPGMPESTRHRALETLFDAGIDGALGLAMACDLGPVERKVAYIQHLGELAVPATAGHLARFLKVNPRGARRAQHAAARKAIEAIGKRGVRHLIPILDEDDYAVWTAEMLRTITGEKLKNDKRKTWERWYKRHRRDLEGDS